MLAISPLFVVSFSLLNKISIKIFFQFIFSISTLSLDKNNNESLLLSFFIKIVISGDWFSMGYSVCFSRDILFLVTRMIERLYNLCIDIVKFYWNNSQVVFEDYVTPQIGNFYEIHRAYLSRGFLDTKVNF